MPLSWKYILLFAPLALAAAVVPRQPDAHVLAKRTYLDLYTHIGRAMNAIQKEANAWSGTGHPDAVIAAIDQLNNAIVAVYTVTSSYVGPLETRDSLALTHFIHLVSIIP
ncbi:hypothetical protein EJ03DRAFT_178368, partial [Teratosphaeria nubilosa]